MAVDGPAGAGKSTVARLLAQELGYTYLDTGAMYRSVALLARRRGVSWDDAGALGLLADGIRFAFVTGTGGIRVWADGEDVSDLIRRPEISQGASQVARWPEVRSALVREQRRLGEAGGVVMEGRDIGTVVFPEAEAKIFLTATVGERARRRAAELAGAGGPADLEAVRREVEERDRRDSERAHSPLRRAEDAREFYTDGLTVPEVVRQLAAWVRAVETR